MYYNFNFRNMSYTFFGVGICPTLISEYVLQIFWCKNMSYTIFWCRNMSYRQGCYAVGARGSAAPIVFLTVGAPLPYFLEWVEYY